MSATNEDDKIITITEEAVVMNEVADRIGAWAEAKGFREDWSDADCLTNIADVIDKLEGGEIDYKGGYLSLIGHNDNGEVSDETIGAALRRIAESHRRLANVCKLFLMVSELSEALEGMRDGGNYGEELADVVIRAFENAEKNNVAIGDEIIRKMAVNDNRAYKHGRKF